MWIHANSEPFDFILTRRADRFFCREQWVVLTACQIPETDAEGEAVARITLVEPLAQARDPSLQQLTLTTQLSEPAEFIERPPSTLR